MLKYVRILFKNWVWAFRGCWLSLVINTNNGVEAQDKIFKYEYLGSVKDSTVTRLMQCLVEEYFLDHYRKYLHSNVTMSQGWRTSADHVPIDLQHRPLQLVQHMKQVDIKATSIPADKISRVDEITFLVDSDKTVYALCLGNEDTMPPCDCREFHKTHMPCKHFGAIFRDFQDVSFSSLPKIYIDNPIFNLDDELFSESDVPKFTKDEHSAVDSPLGNLQEPQFTVTRPELGPSIKRVNEDLQNSNTLSFLVPSKECLETVHGTLVNVIGQMKEVCPKSGGLLLETRRCVQ